MTASALDLTTVSAARNWIFGPSPAPTTNNFVLQMLITSLSLDFLRRTGYGAQNNAVPSQSPFNQAVTYTETYSGFGTPLLAIRNSPVLSIGSVSVQGSAIQASTGDNNPGYYIDPSGKFLGIRLACVGPYLGGGDGWSGWQLGTSAAGRVGGWPRGVNNIQVTYTAGYAENVATNELQTIPTLPSVWQANHAYTNGALIYDGTNVQQCSITQGTAAAANSGASTPSWNTKAGQTTADGPYLVWTNLGPPHALTVNNSPWLSDEGVLYFSDGTPLTAVLTSPTAGQYYLQGVGGYLFNSADAGRQVQISYTYAGTPMDIQEAMLRWVNLIYNRRGWEGIRSLMQKDAGSTIYTGFEIDPSVQAVINSYKRRV